jgi:Fe-S-cluster containining protein
MTFSNGSRQPDAVQVAVAALDRQIERGSFFTQAALQRGFARINQAETVLTRLVEVLADKDLLAPEEVGFTAADDQREGGGEDLEPTAIAWPSIALRVDDPEEQAERLEVDCAARMPVCQAVCCRLSFPLSADEVDSGRVKWDIGHPYVIRQETSGFCTHNDAATRGCRIYEDRPAVCRRYSCVNDGRIWKDFDNMVLNQEWIDEHLGQRDLRVEVVLPAMEEAS